MPSAPLPPLLLYSADPEPLDIRAALDRAGLRGGRPPDGRGA
jgi:hypothetical protein